MQDKKTRKAIIRAEYDPGTGEFTAMVHGGRDDLCTLLGCVLRQIAQSGAAKTGKEPSSIVLGLVTDILEVAVNSKGEDTRIELGEMGVDSDD